MFNIANMQDAPLPMVLINANGIVEFCNIAFELQVGSIPSGDAIESMVVFEGDLQSSIRVSRTQPKIVAATTALDDTILFQAIFSALPDSTSVLVQFVPVSGAEKNMGARAPRAAKHVDVDFLSGISHQIRTPLNGVLGIAELLSETTLTAEQAKYVDILSRSAHALIHLVNEIREISLLDQGSATVAQDNVNVRDVIRDVMDLYAVSGSQKGVTGIADIDTDLPDVIVSDRKKLHQILVALTGNAFHFTDKGKVTIEAHFEKDQGDAGNLVVAISDTGIGIDEERLPGLFKQTKPEGTKSGRSYSKTGLGLILCHELVKLMGGKIAVESRLGRGTKFNVTIPVALAGHISSEVEHSAPVVAQDMGQNDQEGPWNILIAEDNPVNQMLFKKILERIGHSVTVVSNGQEAVRKVQLGVPYDIILMDISMPIMNGLDATAMIRSLYGPSGETPILALTAHAMEGDREEFLNAGMDGYQSKPVDPETLQQAINDVIRVKQSTWAASKAEQSQDGASLS